MKVVTIIVLNDGTEIHLEAERAGFLGLQCQHCLTMYELAGELTGEQAHEVAALYSEHVESCSKRLDHLAGHA